MKLKKVASFLTAAVMSAGLVAWRGSALRADEEYEIHTYPTTVDVYGLGTETESDVGGTITVSKTKAAPDEKITITATARDGYEFHSITYGQEGVVPKQKTTESTIEVVMPDGVLDIYASFVDVREADYTVRLYSYQNDMELETIKDIELSAAEAQSWTVPDNEWFTCPEGYRFVGWRNQNGLIYAPGMKFTVSKKGETLSAEFVEGDFVVTPIQLTVITMDKNGANFTHEEGGFAFSKGTLCEGRGGSISVPKNDYDYGEVVDFEIVANPGYKIEKITYGGEADPYELQTDKRQLVYQGLNVLNVDFREIDPDDLEVLDKVTVFLTVPQGGDEMETNSAGDVLATVEPNTSSPVTAKDAFWFYGGDSSNPDQAWTTGSVPDAFIGDRYYFAKFKIVPDEGYCFDENTKVNVVFTDGIYGDDTVSEAKFSSSDGTISVITTDVKILPKPVGSKTIDPVDDGVVPSSDDGLIGYTWETKPETWEGDGDMGFHIEGDGEEDTSYEDFEGLKIDGEYVDPENYEKERGSLKLTLKESFLKTLEPGEHKLEILFKGDVVMETSIKIKEVAPKTEEKPAEEPKTEEVKPADEPKTEEAKPADEPKTEPKTEEAAPAEEQKTEPKTEEATTPADSETEATPTPTPTTAPTNNAKPKTGDVGSSTRTAVIAFLALCAIASIVLMDRRKKNEEA